MDKKFESLKLRYENTRTWMLTFFVALISMAIGYHVISNESFKHSLGIIMGIVVMATLILYFIQTYRYHKVLNYLEDK